MLTFEAMNTGFLVAGLPPTKAAEVKTLVDNAQNTFSRFDPGSEISKINQLPNQWVAVSPLTFQLLQAAVTAYEKTCGLFSPFLGKIIKNLGYDKSFEKLESAAAFRPCPPSSVAPPALSGISHLPTYLEFDQECSRVRLAPGAVLDLGGIAKGWIAQYASDRLQVCGETSGLIDAGGDIVLWGRHPEHTLWGIGLAHPLGASSDIAGLWCEGTAAIATSSIAKRRWLADGPSARHHIIDPRTEAPACSDLVQVTVLARDLGVAEVYAKCLLILGSEAGPEWLRKALPALGFIAIRADGKVLTSPNLHSYCSEMEVLPYADFN